MSLFELYLYRQLILVFNSISITFRSDFDFAHSSIYSIVIVLLLLLLRLLLLVPLLIRRFKQQKMQILFRFLYLYGCCFLLFCFAIRIVNEFAVVVLFFWVILFFRFVLKRCTDLFIVPSNVALL